MYLRAFGDEELRQWVERVSTWLSDDEKDKIASEFERTGLKALGPIEENKKRREGQSRGKQNHGKITEETRTRVVQTRLYHGFVA